MNLIPPSAMPVQDGARRDLRLRRLREEHGQGARAGRRRRLRGPPRGVAAARQAARPRRGQRRSSRRPAPQPEFAEIRFEPSGSATVLMGSKNQGQGHETTFKQILHERLGLDPARRSSYIDGDTDRVAFGMGTIGSRSTVIGGSALWMAADKVIAKGKKIAAHLLEAAEADIEFADGTVRAWSGTDRRRRAARRSRAPRSSRRSCRRASSRASTRRARSSPTQRHLAQRLPRLRGRDRSRHRRRRARRATSSSTTSAPSSIRHAQGPDPRRRRPGRRARRSWSRSSTTAESGQLLTASFMDYAMPRADTLPDMDIESNPVPDQAQSAGRQGRGRGRHGRRAAGRHQRGDGRAGAARRPRSSTCRPRASASGRRSSAPKR